VAVLPALQDLHAVADAVAVNGATPAEQAAVAYSGNMMRYALRTAQAVLDGVAAIERPQVPPVATAVPTAALFPAAPAPFVAPTAPSVATEQAGSPTSAAQDLLANSSSVFHKLDTANSASQELPSTTLQAGQDEEDEEDTEFAL
jgi:hypothetical protein